MVIFIFGTVYRPKNINLSVCIVHEYVSLSNEAHLFSHISLV